MGFDVSLRYLSYTSFSTYEKGGDEFCLKYMTEKPRDLQTLPMALGSAFDALVKGYLHKILFGEDTTEELWETQVEDAQKDAVRADAYAVFGQYKAAGCVAELLRNSEKCRVPPIFESKVERTVGGVPMLGKPDMYWVDRHGRRVIHDWKVNGYYSKASPAPGYVWRHSNGRPYRGLIPFNGLGKVKEEWKEQLTIYSWLTGADVTDDTLVSVDQVVGLGEKRVDFARFRALVPPGDLLERMQNVWSRIERGWYHADLTFEDSRKRSEQLLGDGWLFS